MLKAKPKEKDWKMASENETVADIVNEMRGIKGGQHTNGGLSFERWRAKCQFADDYADRIEAAHRSDVAELKRKCEEYERQPELMAETAKAALELLKAQDAKIAELRECLAEAVRERCEKMCMPTALITKNEIIRNFCDNKCPYRKWRKALEGANHEGK